MESMTNANRDTTAGRTAATEIQIAIYANCAQCFHCAQSFHNRYTILNLKQGIANDLYSQLITSDSCFSSCLALQGWVLRGVFSFNMARLLLPLSTAQITAYHNVEFLVDVAVQHQDGTADIVTFDPVLLPGHLKDEFLEQLFQWANDEGVLPLSSFGTWTGKDPGSKTMMLLPLYYEWLDDDTHEHNVLE